MTAAEIIEKLGLQPLEAEGGMYRQTWFGGTLPDGRGVGSAIYFLLSGKAFSHLHKLGTDEVYHFYAGCPVELLQLNPDGTGNRVILGNDLDAGHIPQYVVPAGCWQGSHTLAGAGEGRGWALLGTTMSPAFSPDGYEHADGERLKARYPAFAELIGALTGPVSYR